MLLVRLLVALALFRDVLDQVCVEVQGVLNDRLILLPLGLDRVEGEYGALILPVPLDLLEIVLLSIELGLVLLLELIVLLLIFKIVLVIIVLLFHLLFAHELLLVLQAQLLDHLLLLRLAAILRSFLVSCFLLALLTSDLLLLHVLVCLHFIAKRGLLLLLNGISDSPDIRSRIGFSSWRLFLRKWAVDSGVALSVGTAQGVRTFLGGGAFSLELD